MKRLCVVFGLFLVFTVLLGADVPLLNAVRAGMIDEVTAYLDSGKKVDDPIDNGWTLLQHACYAGQPKMIKFLISKGADVNKKIAPNGFKHGPIVSDFAWEWTYFGMETAGVTAYTPLHLALMNLKNRGTSACIKILLDAGADITVPLQFNGFGPKKMVDAKMSVLEFVLTRFTYGMGGPDQVKAAKLLWIANSKLPKNKQIKVGKNIARPNAYLLKENDWIVIVDDAKKVKDIIKKKAVTGQLMTNTVVADSPLCLKAMIAAKSIDKNPKTGYNLLISAVRSDSVEAAKVLIDAGFDPNWVPTITNSADPYNPKSEEIRINYGTPVLYYAVFDYPDSQMGDVLLSKGAMPDESMFGKAVMENRIELVKTFLKKDVKKLINDNLLIDMITCRKPELAPMMELLLKNGGNPNAVSQNLNMNLLGIAESYENNAMAEVLKKYGAVK